MKKLEITYAGLKLRNPLIVASSGLTNSVDKIVALEAAGAGAVVLKSLFEEQITNESHHLASYTESYPEAADYISHYVKANDLENYLTLIREAKQAVSIPVIGSINCYEGSSWATFASSMEQAGADAIELNIQKINSSLSESYGSYEQQHIEILQLVKKAVSIPVIVKISPYFSNLAVVVEQLKAAGAAAVVLFNKFYQPDIDIEKLQITSASVFSGASDLSNTLRWLGILSGNTAQMDLAASTGVIDSASAIKAILAGASAVQICSAIYKGGNGVLAQIAADMEAWLERQNLESMAHCKGMLNYKNIPDQSLYERVQFMKYFSSREA